MPRSVAIPPALALAVGADPPAAGAPGPDAVVRRLRVLRVADGSDRLLAPLGFDGAFSPDGRRVVFLRLHAKD